MKLRPTFIFFLFIAIALKLYPLTEYNSRFYVLSIDSKTKNLIKSLRLNTYKGRLYNAVFFLNRDAVKYRNAFLRLMGRIAKNNQFRHAGRSRDKADLLLNLLHKYLFKAYVGDDPFISSSFERGVYNCVSSTIIYNMACDYFGIKSSAAVVPSHIFSIVHDNIDYDVETTLALGFNAGTKREVRDEFKRLTGFVHVHRSSPDREHITNNDLLAYMFSQEGNVYGEKNMHQKALKYYVISLMIGPKNKPAVSGIKISYHKLALEQRSRGNYKKSVEIMRELYHVLNTREASYAAITYFKNTILLLAKENNFKKAISLLNAYFNDSFLKSSVSELGPMVYQAYSKKLFDEQRESDAISLLKSKSGIYPELKELIGILYNNWIQKLLKKSRFREALKRVKEASVYSSVFKKYIGVLYNKWIYYLATAGQYKKGYSVIKEYYIENGKSDASFRSYFNYMKYYIKANYDANSQVLSKEALEEAKTYLLLGHYKIIKDYYSWYEIIHYLESGEIRKSLILFKNALGEDAGELINSLKIKIAFAAVQYSQRSGRIATLISNLNVLKGGVAPKYLNEAFCLAYYFKAFNEARTKGAYAAIPILYKGLSYASYSNDGLKGMYNIALMVVNSYLSSSDFKNALIFSFECYNRSGKLDIFKGLAKDIAIKTFNHLLQNSKVSQAKEIRDIFIKYYKGESDFEATLSRMRL